MNYLLFNLLQNFETFLFSMPISRINDMFQITAVFAFLLLWFCFSTSAYFCISATADFVLLILTFHLCCCRILPSADYCLSSTADFCMSITADFVFLLLLIVYQLLPIFSFLLLLIFCSIWNLTQSEAASSSVGLSPHGPLSHEPDCHFVTLNILNISFFLFFLSFCCSYFFFIICRKAPSCPRWTE